jgi:Glutathione S-transferase, C-terminal domain
MAVHNTPAALEAYYAAVPDPALRAVYTDVVPQGTKAPRFRGALSAWKQLLKDMSTALEASDWLVGAEETLADIAYIAYLCRLEHLTFIDVWSAYPKVAEWFRRMKQTEGYRLGIEAWLNPKYLALMSERGALARADMAPAIDSNRSNSTSLNARSRARRLRVIDTSEPHHDLIKQPPSQCITDRSERRIWVNFDGPSRLCLHVHVRFGPKGTYIRRCRGMTKWANKRH